MSTYDTTIAYTKNENFNSGGTGGFTANTGTVSNPTGNQLHMTANWASKPLATTSVYLVNGRSYTLNLDIVGFSVVSGFSHTVRVRVVLPGAAFNTDFTTTGTKTITFTSNTTGYVNIEIRSIISPPTGVYSGNPYIDIDNFNVSWDSAFTSSDIICVSKSGYRYGFNGMEKVDEISGEGNGYDFGARMYDDRLGRWFSVDLLTYTKVFYTPYIGIANNPLLYVDIDGNDEFIITTIINKRTGKTTVKKTKVSSKYHKKEVTYWNRTSSSDEIRYNYYNIYHEITIVINEDGTEVEEDAKTSLGVEPAYTRDPITQWIGYNVLMDGNWEGDGDKDRPGGLKLTSDQGGISPVKSKSKVGVNGVSIKDLLTALNGIGLAARYKELTGQDFSSFINTLTQTIDEVIKDNQKAQREKELENAKIKATITYRLFPNSTNKSTVSQKKVFANQAELDKYRVDNPSHIVTIDPKE